MASGSSVMRQRQRCPARAVSAGAALHAARTKATKRAGPVVAAGAAQVGVAGQQVACTRCRRAGRRCRGRAARGRRSACRAAGSPGSIVEFVAAHRACGAVRRRPGMVGGRVQAARSRGRPARACITTSPGIAPTMRRVRPCQVMRARQVHQAAAFGIGRQAAFDGVGGSRRAARRWPRSSAMKTSGKPPPMNRPSTAGRRASCRVSKGTSSAPAASQRLQVVGVVEAEGRSRAMPMRTRRRGAAGRRGRRRRRVPAAAGSARELRAAAPGRPARRRRARCRATRLRARRRFVAGHQAEVALGIRPGAGPAARAPSTGTSV